MLASRVRPGRPSKPGSVCLKSPSAPCSWRGQNTAVDRCHGHVFIPILILVCSCHQSWGCSATWSLREGRTGREEGGNPWRSTEAARTFCVWISLSSIGRLKLSAVLRFHFLKLLQYRLVIRQFSPVLPDVQDLSHVMLEGLWIPCRINFLMFYFLSSKH